MKFDRHLVQLGSGYSVRYISVNDKMLTENLKRKKYADYEFFT